MRDDLVGKTLEKCRLVSRLGSGGMGSVYLAEHAGLNRKVAVKVLPSDMGRDPEFVARFRREATTAGRLEHPNIVQIYDVGHAEDRHFIVMQYVDGESLSTAVEALGTLDPEDAARIGAGILRGLHHAHEQGVVHRDVKPDNVLIARGNEPKLLDFGLALESEEALNLTRAGMVVGTPYYVSPEQARGLRATPRSDVYSTGVLLYFLLTARRPFTGATALAVLNKHVKERPVPLRAHNPRVPAALGDIVFKMMAKRPEDRYATAAAAADDLENFLAGRPVRAEHTRGPLPHARLLALAAGAVAAALAAVLFFRGGTDAPPPPPPAPEAAAGEAELERIERLRRERGEDPAAFRVIVDRYESFLRAHEGTEAARRARRALSEFRGETEARADRLHRTISAEPDPVRRLEALEKFPVPLLDTPAGARARADRAGAAREIEEAFARRRTEFEARLREGDLKAARTLLAGMLQGSLPDRRPALDAHRADLEARERALNDPALLKLREDYARVHAAFEQALARRETAAAYRQVAAFLAATADPRARVPGVNYDLLLALVPDSTLSSEKLGDARVATATAWAQALERPAADALTDLQDALDVEWLLRRSSAGLASLSKSAKEIPLATLGGAGRVELGPSGYGFVPKGGAERPIVVRDLHPVDLIALAAAADQQTVDAAFASNAALARAGGAAYLYSASPDRWAGAARWLRRAGELKFPGPAGRLETVAEIARSDLRARLESARKDVAARRYEAARRALAALETLAQGDPALKDEVSLAAAAALTEELREAYDAHAFARVRELARSLRASYEGRYDEAAVGRLHRRAILATGTWTHAPMDLKDEFWTWEGRREGAPPPAGDDRHEGFRLNLKRRLGLAPARTKGATGLSFQLRLNGTAEAPGLSVEWGARLALRAAEAALLSGEGKPLAKGRAGKLVPGSWVDVAIVSEEGELGVFIDGEEVLGLRGGPAIGATLGLSSDGDANVRSIRLRK